MTTATKPRQKQTEALDAKAQRKLDSSVIHCGDTFAQPWLQPDGPHRDLDEGEFRRQVERRKAIIEPMRAAVEAEHREQAARLGIASKQERVTKRSPSLVTESPEWRDALYALGHGDSDLSQLTASRIANIRRTVDQQVQA